MSDEAGNATPLRVDYMITDILLSSLQKQIIELKSKLSELDSRFENYKEQVQWEKEKGKLTEDVK